MNLTTVSEKEKKKILNLSLSFLFFYMNVSIYLPPPPLPVALFDFAFHLLPFKKQLVSPFLSSQTQSLICVSDCCNSLKFRRGFFFDPRQVENKGWY